MRTQHSVIPDASVLVEDWERAAAGRSDLEPMPVRTRPGIVLLIALGMMALTGLAGRWLCGC